MIVIKSTKLSRLNKEIDKAHDRMRLALLNALKTEGFSLRETMANAIRMGKTAPGSSLKDLSIIARTINRRAGMRQPKPLLRLASGVTYTVNPTAGEVRVGFTKRSPSWVRTAAKRQQAGFTRRVTFEMRQHFRRVGAQRLFGRLMRGEKMENQDWKKRVLFLRGSTTHLVTPARPIVAPFWAAEKEKSAVRIRRNFRLIARGKVAPGGNLYSQQDMAMW